MQLGHFAPHWILFSSVRLSLFGLPDSAATETYPTARERSLQPQAISQFLPSSITELQDCATSLGLFFISYLKMK